VLRVLRLMNTAEHMASAGFLLILAVLALLILAL